MTPTETELQLLKEQGDACNELALMHPQQRFAYASCHTAFRHHEQRIREAYEQERARHAALLADCQEVLTHLWELVSPDAEQRFWPGAVTKAEVEALLARLNPEGEKTK